MNQVLKWLIPSGLARDLLARFGRWAGTAVGAAVTTWLLVHKADLETAQRVGGDIAELVRDCMPLLVPVLMLWLSGKDAQAARQQIADVRTTTADAMAVAAGGNGGAAAMAKALRRGDVVIVGERLPQGEEREKAMTAALNLAQIHGVTNGSGG